MGGDIRSSVILHRCSKVRTESKSNHIRSIELTAKMTNSKRDIYEILIYEFGYDTTFTDTIRSLNNAPANR